MRVLFKEELDIVIRKLMVYLGPNVQSLVTMEPPHVFRLVRDRVFFTNLELAKAAICIPSKSLCSVGTALGKFTKTKKFRVQITALEILAAYAPYKVWLKTHAESSFLYGNHVAKRHIAKITENAPEKAGIIILSPTNLPLGFGILSRGTVALRSADTETIAVFNQGDIGLYIRKEREMFGGGVNAAKSKAAFDDNEVPDLDA